MGVSENVVYPIVANGFADHYPYDKWLFHWEYTQHFQTNPWVFCRISLNSHYSPAAVAVFQMILVTVVVFLAAIPVKLA